jgi:DNA-binding NarL/FixJ family response regulator
MNYQQKNLRVSLSAREKEVLKFLAQGLSNKDIAVNMRLSPSTVKRHVENILRKLQLKNRVEAAVYAITKATRASEGLTD